MSKQSAEIKEAEKKFDALNAADMDRKLLIAE